MPDYGIHYNYFKPETGNCQGRKKDGYRTQEVDEYIIAQQEAEQKQHPRKIRGVEGQNVEEVHSNVRITSAIIKSIVDRSLYRTSPTRRPAWW